MLLLIQTLAFAKEGLQGQRVKRKFSRSKEWEKMKKQRMADGSLPAVACSDSKILHPQHTVSRTNNTTCVHSSHVLDLVFVHVVVLTSCHQIFLEFCMLGDLETDGMSIFGKLPQVRPVGASNILPRFKL